MPTRVLDNGDNTYTVELAATQTGTYTTNLFYGGVKVPTSPKTNVNPPIDVTKVKVDGLEPSKYQFFFIFQRLGLDKIRFDLLRVKGS